MTCARSVLWAKALNCDNLRLPAISRGYSALWPREVPRHYPQTHSTYLMSKIGEDSESDDDFDGWLNDDHRERDDETSRHSMSLVSGHCSPMQLNTLSPLAHTFVSPPIIYITALTTSCLSSQKHIMLYYRWLMLPFYLACRPS